MIRLESFMKVIKVSWIKRYSVDRIDDHWADMIDTFLKITPDTRHTIHDFGTERFNKIIKALRIVFQLNSKGSNYWLKTVDIYNLFCTTYYKEKAILIFFYHELSLNLHQSKSVLTFKCPSSSNTSMVKILTIHEIFLLHVLEVYVTFISHF